MGAQRIWLRPNGATPDISAIRDNNRTRGNRQTDLRGRAGGVLPAGAGLAGIVAERRLEGARRTRSATGAVACVSSQTLALCSFGICLSVRSTGLIRGAAANYNRVCGNGQAGGTGRDWCILAERTWSACVVAKCNLGRARRAGGAARNPVSTVTAGALTLRSRWIDHGEWRTIGAAYRTRSGADAVARTRRAKQCATGCRERARGTGLAFLCGGIEEVPGPTCASAQRRGTHPGGRVGRALGAVRVSDCGLVRAVRTCLTDHNSIGKCAHKRTASNAFARNSTRRGRPR